VPTQVPSAVPAGTSWQIPTEPPTLHDEHKVQLEVVQHTPSTQLPLPHWPEADQVIVDQPRMKIAVTTPRPARIVVEMVKWLDEHGVELADIRIKRPSLEDAFIELTGKSLRE